jgi:predicted DNA-binding transcriptional regulator AlpA
VAKRAKVYVVSGESMQRITNAADSRKKTESNTTAPADRLLTFRQVGDRIGLACKTSHTARALAARGQIQAVRINERVVRYSEASVNALIAGRIDPVAAPRRSSAKPTAQPSTPPTTP